MCDWNIDQPTYSLVGIDAGELGGAIVALLGFLLVLSVFAIRPVTIHKAKVNQTHLPVDGI